MVISVCKTYTALHRGNPNINTQREAVMLTGDLRSPEDGTGSGRLVGPVAGLCDSGSWVHKFKPHMGYRDYVNK